MASDVKVRVLQSGKVYRQMFDAEVQLVKSLQFTSSKRNTDSNKLPLINARNGKNSTGLLSERQKLWTRGKPNDSTTENPTLRRQLTAEAAEKLIEKEVDVEARLVRGLPEVITEIDNRPNITERINQKRKLRHDETVNAMHDELSQISNDLEPKIVRVGQALQQQLKENDSYIEFIFGPIISNDELINFGHDQLNSIWDEVEKQAAIRRTWIKEADLHFHALEKERMDAIAVVFRKNSVLLETIAYLLPQDLQRFIEKESMMVNQGVLANRRAFVQLHTNLMENDIQSQMVHRLSWQEKVQDWKALNAEAAVEQFKSFMESDKIRNPPNINEIIQGHLKEQDELVKTRLEILQQLDNFKPPSSTKTAVYKWNAALAKSNENIDQLHLKFLQAINAKYESVCQQCLVEIDKYRHNLVLSKVCTEEDVQRIVTEHMLPLVGSQQKQFEINLEKLDHTIEAYATQCENQLKSLFKFAQGAAHLWDVHEITLAKQERKLQSTLDQIRQKHDLENQERESKLDVVMDRLRQESTEEALASCLQRSLEMLEVIFDGYKEFHSEQLKYVESYPSKIEDELSNYDKNVCHFFNVDRRLPTPAKSPVEKARRASQEASRASLKSAGSRPQSSKERRMTIAVASRSIVSVKSNASSKQSRQNSTISSSGTTTPPSEENSALILRDTLVTEKGTMFFVILKADKEDFEEDGENDDPRNSHTLFLTEVEDMDPSLKSIVENVTIENTFFKDIKKRIRISFLNHLEQWKERSLAVASGWRRDKIEELESELDLRLHLHAPRPKRIELDVHNVRAAELVLHKERVLRHCKGITAALLGLKEEFDKLTKEHDGLALQFKNSIESMETIFINATKSSRLTSLTESLHSELDDYMTNIKASLRNFRQKLDATLSRLRDSNAKCLMSFKLFSQGGNFSPDETVGLRKKLEKMSQKVDSGEGLIMQDLEGMESKRLDQATDVIAKFEDRFRNHMTDLIFMEKIQRWITNAQVRIKTEVAYCNGEAAQINSHVQAMHRRIDACKHPNIDKETVSTTMLHEYLLEVMNALHTHADYLNCRKSLIQNQAVPVEPATSRVSVSEPSMTNLPKPSSRQKGHRGRSTSQKENTGSMTAPSRSDLQVAGKRGPQEDVAIGMIKSILRTQRMGDSQDADDMRSVVTRYAPSTSTSQLRIRKGAPPLQRQGTISSQSGSLAESDKGKKQSEGFYSRVTSGVYKRRETKFDLRFMIFGVSAPKEKYFTAKIQLILYETLDGLLSLGELYYKQKGSRAPTRPNHIQETFDVFAEAVAAKLANFQTQTDEFWNSSLQEFRQHLKSMEENIAEIPSLLLGEVQAKWLDSLHNTHKKLNIAFAKKEDIWNNTKEKHRDTLRPTMGHPDSKETLRKLIDDENARQEENALHVKNHSLKMKEEAKACVMKLAENIYQSSNTLLKQLDNLLTIDDVVTGKIPLKREKTSILLRQKAAGQDILNTSYSSTLPRGPSTWQGLDMELFDLGSVESNVTEPISTKQTTLAHTSTVDSSSEIMKSFANTYHSIIKDINEEEATRLRSEERWAESWSESVEHVQNLYS